MFEGVYIWLSKMGFWRKERPASFGKLWALDSGEKNSGVISCGWGERGKRKK